MRVHNKILFGLCCLALLGLGNVQMQPVGQSQTCHWQLVSAEEKLASTSSEMTVSRSGNSLQTAYRHAGNMGCAEQNFQTTHTWTDPGSTLAPGQTLSFDVTTAWNLDGKPSCTSLTAGVNTSIVAGATRIQAERKKIIVSREPNGSVSNSGSWVVPQGSKVGEILTITARGDGGGVGGSVFYKYQWVCEAPAASETPETRATPAVTLTPSKFICPCPPDQGGDSGARFSDFSGEVTVAHCSNPKDLYPAEMDMVLERGMYINTEAESSAILSFADMTTFAMKPFTRVFLECRPPKETKLQLLGGKVWVNIKKMLKDGTLNVELNQAIAGAKGTVFVLEEDGQVSTVKVLQGSVSFTSRATGESVLVNPGEMVSANAAGLAAAIPFDTGQELGSWPPALVMEMNGEPLQAEAPEPGPAAALPIWVIACLVGVCGLLGLGGLGLGLFFWLKKPGKAARASGPRTVSATQLLLPVWQLTALSGPEAGKRFQPGQFARLGSAPQNEIWLNDPQVAPFHAQIQQTPQGCLLSDLGSPGGTFVNGARIQGPVLLRQGDRLRLGNTTLQIVFLSS